MVAYRAFCWWNVVITGLKPLQPIDYSEFEPTLMRCLTKSYLTNVFGSFQRSSPTCSFGETLHYYKQVLHGSYPSSQHCSYAHLTALGLASKLATFECSTMWWYVSESPSEWITMCYLDCLIWSFKIYQRFQWLLDASKGSRRTTLFHGTMSK